MTVYDNAPTVVVVLIPSSPTSFLGVVRRDNGKTALPGGYQMRGETWQQAGVREVKEETGVDIDPSRLKVVEVITSPVGMNLLFCQTDETMMVPTFFSEETYGVCDITKSTPLAFPLHEEIVRRVLK